MYIANHLPWFWLGVMIVCLLVESFTLALTTLWFACGALVLIFASFLPIAFRWQFLLFLAISCALLVFTRPLALRRFKLPRAALNSDGLVGKTVLLTATASAHEKGAAKVNGVVWSVASADGAHLAAGSECVVTAIEGATLVVAAAAPATAGAGTAGNGITAPTSAGAGTTSPVVATTSGTNSASAAGSAATATSP